VTTFADVAEGVRATIATYAQALDDGRTDDVVATFCADGSTDIPGLGAHTGHDALRGAFAAVAPHVPQRHLVANTVVTDWNDHEATAVSDVIFMVKGEAEWSILLVGRYTDTLHCTDGVWKFHHRAAVWLT
jgi:hypothetical protein